MNNDFDIAILGGGCIGASIFFAMKGWGSRRVCLIDEGRKTESATAHSGGMLRVFHENPCHVELALANFRALSEAHLSPAPPSSGTLYFFHRSRFRDYEAILRMMDQADYPFEVVTSALGRERFPLFNWSEEDWAIFEPLAGHRDALRMNEELIAGSVRLGATVLDQTFVRRITRHTDRYRLCTGNDFVSARSVVIAGGARVLPCLKELGLSLPLTSQKLRVHVVESGEARGAPHFFDRETLEYGRLGHEATALLSNEAPARLKARVGKTLSVREAADCYAPGRIGLLGQLPGYPRLTLATGWGGTAFKFALEIGRRTAAIVEREFDQGRLMHESL